MKHLKIIVSFALAFFLLLSIPNAPARAGLDYNERIQFQDDFDSCSGERVLVSGVQHITGHVISDSSGKKHFTFTRNTYATGLGYESGDSYIFVDSVYQASIELDTLELQSFSQVYHSRLIRRAEKIPGDDTLIRFLTRFNFDANGNLVTSIEIQDVSCG